MSRAALLFLCLAAACSPGTARAQSEFEVAPGSAAVEAAWRRFLLKQFGHTLANLAPRKGYSPREIALGREMFFDPGLSRDKTLSCSTCHVPDRAWTDGLPRARGAGVGAARRELSRNTLSLLGVRFRSRFFWDGRAKSVAQASLVAAGNPEEMNMPPDDLAAALRASAEYRARFARAYGARPITAALAGRALAAFVESVPRAGPSPFERFAKDRSALTPLQREGFVLFTGKAHCLRCHGGPFFSTGRATDVGLKRAPGDPEGKPRKFVAPPLLDVALTPPYMHDGSLATLADVVEFYNRGGDEGPDQELTRQDARIVPLKLTAAEKRALVAFLESLGPPVPEPAGTAAATAASAPAANAPAASASAASAPVPGAAAPAPSGASGEDEAEPAGDDPACVERFSLKRLLAGDGASASDDSTRSFGGEIVSYQAAAAFRAGSLRACDELKLREGAGERGRSLAPSCKEEAVGMLALQALAARSPEYPRYCARELAGEAPALSAPERAEICGLVLAHVDDPDRLCSLLADRFVFPWQREACVFEFAAFSRFREKDYCGRDEDGDLQEGCRDVTAYSRARLSGRVEDCGDSRLCRTMLDKTDLARRYELIRTLACLKRG